MINWAERRRQRGGSGGLLVGTGGAPGGAGGTAGKLLGLPGAARVARHESK